MKKNYIFTLFLSLITALSFGQGAETFTNSTATNSYSDGSFVGENGVTWTYVASRQADGNFNSTEITTMNLPALLLRRSSDDSKITSSTVSGGIADFSLKLFKGFTGGGDRQVELFVNGVSKGVSTIFDDFTEHVFNVNGINIAGDVIIEVKNTTGKQIIIDDLTWTAYDATASVKDNAIEGFATYPNPITNNEFTVSSLSNAAKSITIFNLLGKKVLSKNFSGTKSTIDVSTINAGIYILKVTEEGKTSTKKLVIR
ncbi:T9SS type A sorting domain-containing protein [Polaribacter sp. PL03]|uniref:T9SS type A sorting domain-containing protein n=1 Tax=Polaribacter sp. PL03 TaxID=3088353 RepID=UPI0029D11026|nr:T9SS type A sorting domain-containing protein [Polaribacter sp. PL03]MDX6745237.1 T9SS type A sorting domain-containing protein [Polaribacter sp. PL03]